MSISELATRLGGWPRRLIALGCLLLAGVTAVGARRSSAPQPGRPVVVAAHDLAAGAAVTAADLRLRSWPDELRPAGVLTRPGDAIGHRVAGPVRAGEALTASRLTGVGLTAGLPPALRAVPVQVSGGNLVHAGDSIDLLVSDPPDPAAIGPPGATGPPTAHVLAEGARVLAVAPAASMPGVDGADIDIVVAVDRATSLRIAAVSGRTLVAAVRNPP